MCELKTLLSVVSLFIFQVNHFFTVFLSHFNCLFFSSQRTRKDNNKALRAAANGEAVFVNGGIHLETLSVNCATQYAAQSSSDHHAVTKHSTRTHRMHTEALRSLVLRGGTWSHLRREGGGEKDKRGAEQEDGENWPFYLCHTCWGPTRKRQCLCAL